VTPQRRFAAGEVVAWRNCPRDASGRHGPSFAIGMRVVRDEPGELVLYRGQGYPMRRRNSERGTVPGFRHQPVRRLLDGWAVVPEWSRSHVLLVMDPNGKHATSLFSNATTGAPEFWYVDLIGPVARRGACLDFLEHGLDVVIELDLRRWKFKDADELEWNVTNGVYNRAEADALYAEGEAAVAELIRSRARFEQWLAWTPDPSWEPPQMPAGWDAV